MVTKLLGCNCKRFETLPHDFRCQQLQRDRIPEMNWWKNAKARMIDRYIECIL